MPDLDTIKSLARKLEALSAPDSGATYAERRNASEKLERLLERHQLTLDDLASDRLYDVPFVCWSKGEARLLIQCAFFVTDRERLSRTEPRRWIKGKPGKVTIMQITQADAADIEICYNHYRQELEARVEDLNKKITEARTAIRNAPSAIIQRNKIFSSHAGGKDDDTPLTPAQLKKLQELIVAMRGLEANRWERPAGKVDSDRLALGWEGAA